MTENEIIRWLYENGDPIIKYRTVNELMVDNSQYDLNRLMQNVLTSPYIVQLLEYFENLTPIEQMDIKTLNLLHNSRGSCLENVIPRLLEAGFNKGNTIFDRKIQIFRPFLKRVLHSTNNLNTDDIEQGRAIFIAIILSSYFLRAGYDFPEVRDLILMRLRNVHKITKARSLDIYMNEQEKANIAKKWQAKPIIRAQYEPSLGEMPLPLIHDIYAFAYLVNFEQIKEIKKQIKDIVDFILTPEFRQLPWGYGYEYNRKKRYAYGIGWSPNFPDWKTDSVHDKKILIQRLELLSHFEGIKENPWFQDGLDYFKQFRLTNGHYIFPKEYLAQEKMGYYVGGHYMGLENTRRTQKSLEIESTFRMMLIQKNILNKF